MQDPAQLSDIEIIIKNFLHLAIRLAGIAVFIMLIVGGFKWMTAGGDPKSAESARNTITYAIFGLVLVIASWFVLRFISSFTGLPNILEFVFPQP